MAACDVHVSLRSPTMGETSGTAIRALSLGKPLVVSDVGWFAELPDGVALRVAVGDREIDDLTAALAPPRRAAGRASAMGAAARELATSEHDLARVAERQAAAFERVAGGAAVADAVLREVSEAAGAVGIAAGIARGLGDRAAALRGRPRCVEARPPRARSRRGRGWPGSSASRGCCASGSCAGWPPRSSSSTRLIYTRARAEPRRHGSFAVRGTAVERLQHPLSGASCARVRRVRQPRRRVRGGEGDERDRDVARGDPDLPARATRRGRARLRCSAPRSPSPSRRWRTPGR